MEILKITNKQMNSCSYLLTEQEKKEVWLVDCGDCLEIAALVLQNNYCLKGVFLTHTHFDHIYGLNFISEFNPDISIYTNKEGVGGLKSDKLNLSRYHGEAFCYTGDNIVILQDQQIITLWENVSVKCIYTPGHDKSCVSYVVENRIFTGDSFIPGLKTITTFPNSNREDAEKSEQIISSYLDKCIVYPGH